MGGLNPPMDPQMGMTEAPLINEWLPMTAPIMGMTEAVPDTEEATQLEVVTNTGHEAAPVSTARTVMVARKGVAGSGVARSAVALATTDATPAQIMVGILEAASGNEALEAVNGNAAPTMMIKTNGGVNAPAALDLVDPTPTTLSPKPLPQTPSTAVGGLGLSSHPDTVTFKVTVKGNLEFRLGPILARSTFPLEPHMAMESPINK